MNLMSRRLSIAGCQLPISLGDGICLALLVGLPSAFLGAIGWQSIQPVAVPSRDFFAIAQWFDPIFLQYNLVMVLLAVCLPAAVSFMYVISMTQRKQRRLRREVPEAEPRIAAHFSTRDSFASYFGSLALVTMVIMLGAGIILLFKPSIGAEAGGVDFAKGANMLMAGPYFELYPKDMASFYRHLIRNLTAFQFGFLGAFLYFLGTLNRAYFTYDLTPRTFIDGALRMIVASILALMLSYIPFFHGDIAHVGDHSGPFDTAYNWLPVLCFMSGFYPKRTLVVLDRIIRENMKWLFPAEDDFKSDALTGLASISYDQAVRLEREGIENLENLIHADPLSLAVRTPYCYTQIKDWIDQAKLAAHLREDYREFVNTTGLSRSRDLNAYFQQIPTDRRQESIQMLLEAIADPARKARLTVKLATQPITVTP